MMKKWRVILMQLLIIQLVKESISGKTKSCKCQAEIVKYKNNYLQCTVSKSCQNDCGVPVMKILTQSSENTASSFGKFIKSNNAGVLVALCYIKVDNTGCNCDYDWIVKTYRISSNQQSGNNRFSINEFGENDEPNFNVNDPEVNVRLISRSYDSYVVTCRHTYSVNRSQELHQLFRILPNKESFKVLIDAANITGTISEDNKLVTIEYKHSFKYAAEYFNNRFECRFVHKFMEQSQSRMTDAITKEIKCNRLKIDYEENNPINFMSDVMKGIYKPWPDKVKCSCIGVAYPKPQIRWTANFSLYSAGIHLQTMSRIASDAIVCCQSKQTFPSGQIYSMQTCLTGKTNFNIDPWIIVQRRNKRDISFVKKWDFYKYGFGNRNGDFWLGNEKLHELTSAAPMMIRFDLWDKDGDHVYAQYSSFYVGSESDNYRLSISGYSGTAGNSMIVHNDMMFSTYNRDNDKSPAKRCSQERGDSGWWFVDCDKDEVNLNGLYMTPGTKNISSVNWYNFRGYMSLKSTIIKIAYR